MKEFVYISCTYSASLASLNLSMISSTLLAKIFKRFLPTIC